MIDSKPTIAVAGGSGLVGHHALEALARRGRADTLNLSRPDFDLFDETTWKALPIGIDCVIMAAGLITAPPDLLALTNTGATGAFSKHCRSIGVKKFVLLSSGAVYGDTDEPSHPGLSARPTSDYGKSKLAGEQLVSLDWSAENLAILRLYFPYGPGQKLLRLVPALLKSIRVNKEIVCRPDGGPYLTMTHVEDLVEIMLDDFVFGGKHGTSNLASANVASIEQFASYLAQQLMQRPLSEGTARPEISFRDPIDRPGGGNSTLWTCCNCNEPEWTSGSLIDTQAYPDQRARRFGFSTRSRKNRSTGPAPSVF